MLRFSTWFLFHGSDCLLEDLIQIDLLFGRTLHQRVRMNFLTQAASLACRHEFLRIGYSQIQLGADQHNGHIIGEMPYLRPPFAFDIFKRCSTAYRITKQEATRLRGKVKKEKRKKQQK